jgi:hypothetical protein
MQKEMSHSGGLASLASLYIASSFQFHGDVLIKDDLIMVKQQRVIWNGEEERCPFVR